MKKLAMGLALIVFFSTILLFSDLAHRKTFSTSPAATAPTADGNFKAVILSSIRFTVIGLIMRWSDSFSATDHASRNCDELLRFHYNRPPFQQHKCADEIFCAPHVFNESAAERLCECRDSPPQTPNRRPSPIAQPAPGKAAPTESCF